jgi:hypothetical protein
MLTVSGDRNVIKKEAEEILKDLKSKKQSMWNIKTKMTPVIPEQLSAKARSQGTKKAVTLRTAHTPTSESASVQVRNIQHGK